MNQYKSEGERIIAGILTQWNIDFRYEHPILIKETKENDTEKLRIWYPDFWLPKYNIIIEYWGMEGNPAYDEGKKNKMAAYRNLDIDCIPVYRSTVQKDLKSYLLIKIKTLLTARVRHFDNRNK